MKIRFGIILLTGGLLVGSLSAQVAMRNNSGMYVGGSASRPGLYIGGGFVATGASAIRHPGKTVLAGNFANNVTSANVFQSGGLSTGIYEFRGGTAQSVTATASKAANYILFPHTIVINNAKDSVTIAPSAAANMKDITFTKGRLILDSETTVLNESQMAHLWLEDNAATVANTDAKANIQVNMRLGEREGHLVGFTPPFESMYADYFFFNFLSIPSETQLFNGYGNTLWNTNPKRQLKAGTGYILGQVLVPYSNTTYYNTHLDPQWTGALLTDMRRDTFAFNRHLQVLKSFGDYVSGDAALTDRYTGEKLVNSDVAITLQNGYNYLGNPFMVPLDLSDLLTASRTDWGITGSDVMENYYILNKGATGNSADGVTFLFTATYLVGQSVGATTDPIDGVYGNSNLIAPMQMFVLKNNGAAVAGFKIPRNKRTHGTTSFLRSGFTNEPADELLIEARDTRTGGYDRLAVVFRSEATEAATDRYDAEKLFNRSGGVSQIYTRSTDGKQLTTNVISQQTAKLTMYLEPPIEAQEIELEAYRLQSLRTIGQVVLEDTKTGQMADLTANPLYAYNATPADNPARFVLHFRSTPTALETIAGATTLHATCRSGTTYVYGLTDKDMGGYISLYNMQGQLLHKEKVTETTPMQIRRPLPTGIYIVRTSEGKAVKLKVEK